LTQQGDRQAVFRTQASTAGTYNEDFRAFIFSVAPSLDVLATLDVWEDRAVDWDVADDIWGVGAGSGQTMNGLMYEWLILGDFLQDTLSGKLQAFAQTEGAFNWSSLGAFTPTPLGGVFSADFSPEFS